MQTDKSRSTDETLDYDLGPGTEIYEKKETDVLSPDKIEKEYGLAKPRRTLIKAKILSE